MRTCPKEGTGFGLLAPCPGPVGTIAVRAEVGAPGLFSRGGDDDDDDDDNDGGGNARREADTRVE